MPFLLVNYVINDATRRASMENHLREDGGLQLDASTFIIHTNSQEYPELPSVKIAKLRTGGFLHDDDECAMMGLIHPCEGYGTSDRAKGLSDLMWRLPFTDNLKLSPRDQG